jgi:hypothetical protein
MRSDAARDSDVNLLPIQKVDGRPHALLDGKRDVAFCLAPYASGSKERMGIIYGVRSVFEAARSSLVHCGRHFEL